MSLDLNVKISSDGFEVTKAQVRAKPEKKSGKPVNFRTTAPAHKLLDTLKEKCKKYGLTTNGDDEMSYTAIVSSPIEVISKTERSERQKKLEVFFIEFCPLKGKDGQPAAPELINLVAKEVAWAR